MAASSSSPSLRQQQQQQQQQPQKPGGGGATGTNNRKSNNRLASGLALAVFLALVFNANLLYIQTTTSTSSSIPSSGSFLSALPSNGDGTTSADCPCARRASAAATDDTTAAVAAATDPCPSVPEQLNRTTATKTSGGAISRLTRPQQQHLLPKDSAAHRPPDNTSSSSSSSLLLPAPADYLRRGIDLASIYAFPSKVKNEWCSCANPHVNSTVCCQRLFRRVHKMGYVLTLDLFTEDFPQLKLYGIHPEALDYTQKPRQPPGDFRDVLLWRDMYNSIVSGYLYHRDGRECYKDPWGNPSTKHHFALVRSWKKHLSYEIPEHQRKMMFCNYLLRTNEEVGLRAYIEWVFSAHYRVMLSAWALAQGFPHVGERTLSVCYEDLASKSEPGGRADVTMTRVLDHLFNGTKHKPWKGFAPGATDAGGHATSKDPDTRKRLVKIVKRVDHEFYDGDIAWLDSMLPC